MSAPMKRERLIEGLKALNAPSQGMSYHAGGLRRGDPRFDCYTGERLKPSSRPAELTVYGERAQFLYELIQNGEAIAALLEKAPSP